ncbi:MAG: alpha/beta hydrolase [Polyangiaceae bacterium]|jgi:pimeloyl-ACP methyl ester carboxylesterase
MARTLLDHPLLSSRYFFPRRGSLHDAFLVTTADGSAQLACYRAAPHADALTVLHFHGNAEIVSDYVPEVAEVVTSFGVNVVFAEYRGYGASTGSPSLGAMIDDAEVVFQAVGLPAERIVAFGRSLGSLFAVEVVARHPDAAGLVIESGIADPLEATIARVSAEDLGTSPHALAAEVAARFDQRAKLAAYRGPILVLHTAQDMLIPASHAERLASWGGAPATEKKLVIFPQGDHGTIYPANRAAYIAELGSFLGRLRVPGANRRG